MAKRREASESLRQVEAIVRFFEEIGEPVCSWPALKRTLKTVTGADWQAFAAMVRLGQIAPLSNPALDDCRWELRIGDKYNRARLLQEGRS